MRKPWIKLYRDRSDSAIMDECPVDRCILTDMLAFTDDDGRIRVGSDPVRGLIKKMGSSVSFKRLLPKAIATGVRIGMIEYADEYIRFTSWSRYQPDAARKPSKRQSDGNSSMQTQSEKRIEHTHLDADSMLTRSEKRIEMPVSSLARSDLDDNSMPTQSEKRIEFSANLPESLDPGEAADRARSEPIQASRLSREEKREIKRREEVEESEPTPPPSEQSVKDPETAPALSAWTAPPQVPDDPHVELRRHVVASFQSAWHRAHGQLWTGHDDDAIRRIVSWAASTPNGKGAVDGAIAGFFGDPKKLKTRHPIKWLAEDPGYYAEMARKSQRTQVTAAQRAERKRLADEAERAKREREAAEAMLPDEIEAGMGQLISMIGRRL